EMAGDQIKAQAKSQGLGTQALALVTDSPDGRRFYSSDETTADVDPPDDAPDAALAGKALNDLGTYGFRDWSDVHTNRQLVMLEAFAEAIADVPDQVMADGGDEVYAATVTSIL